jgi:hypothetical protein
METDMKIVPTFIAFAMASAAAADDFGQLAASAGLPPGEAAGLTLGEIAAHKFNRSVSAGDRQAVGLTPATAEDVPGQLAAAAGLGPEADSLDLSVVAAHFFNRSGPAQDAQTVTLTSRTAPVVPTSDLGQLAAGTASPPTRRRA